MIQVSFSLRFANIRDGGRGEVTGSGATAITAAAERKNSAIEVRDVQNRDWGGGGEDKLS
jgi:hypothetical protein